MSSSHLNLSNRRRSSCARGFVWRNGECVRMGHWGNQTRSGQNARKIPGDGSHTVTSVLDCVACYAGYYTCHICDHTMANIK